MVSRRLIFALTAIFLSAASTPSNDARLEQARNLGKAFYENPTTGAEAVAEFKKALDLAPSSIREKLNYALALLHGGSPEPAVKLLKEIQKADPKLPHTWFNLGVWYRKNGDAAQAIAQFEAMLRLTPDEPIVHYQLGALYRQEGRNPRSHPRFEQALKLNPLLGATHFQLYNLYRQAGRTAEASEQLKIFQDLKKQQENSAVPEDVDWCNYAEIYDPPRQVTPPPATPPTLADRALPGTVDPSTAGLLAMDSTGKGQTDLLVWSAAGVSLFLRGTTPAPNSGLNELRGVLHIAQGDFDNDGLSDLCVLTERGPELYRNAGGRFAPFTATLPQRRFDRAIWVDYDHDYDLDLLLLGETSALIRNQGTAGFTDRTPDFPFVNARATDVFRMRVEPDTKAFDLAVFYQGRQPVLYRDQLGGHFTTTAFTGKPRNLTEIEADFDGDGRVDRARINGNSVHFLHNETRAASHCIRVQLAGLKSLKLGQDAEVEVKAGQLYRKSFYDGAPLTFDIGGATQADVVRITWMNGLIQSEVRLAANKTHRIEEAQRLSGSCPMIWTWNGHSFDFITDVLGVAPLGASDGDGTYFPVDHDEFVSIPGKSLKPRNGAYEIRITEELSEVSYLDQLQLEAIDHPSNTEIFTNEKFKSPPYPEDRLYQVRQRIYPDASTPGLQVTFPSTVPATATLFLNGWVDWPDGSTFRAISQRDPRGYTFPRLEMQDASGHWQIVNADMGMPAGKPKTIAVDLHFISPSRTLRITTSLPVHWNEIFLAGNTANPQVERRILGAATADLHYRGFSQAVIDPARQHPDTYTYALASTAPFWNPTPGHYTRFGDVLDLTGRIDDRMVIMGSGDELTLRFPDTLPPVKPGWTRDFLLKVDGWAKDRDANTAHSDTVGPLPFHAMSVYPYPAGEHYPDDAEHQRYRREYNTRPALRPLRPLTE